jgi:hypothetical protein
VSEILPDAEDDATLAVQGVAAASGDVDVGVDIGQREVDSLDVGDHAKLPIPVVVVRNAVV